MLTNPRQVNYYPEPSLRRPARPLLRVVKRIFKWTIIAMLLLALTDGGWIAWKLAANAAAHGGLLGLFQNHQLKGENRGQVNFLLAGDSADDPGHGGSDLTDSVMIVSFNTTTHTATAISIPRDLWVDVPGYGSQKINAVYEDGGMPLLEQVIQQDFGIPIDYYVLANYNGFRSAIDSVGGITVDIHSSDPRGIYDPNIQAHDNGPLILKNGSQTLDGQTALNLARARNDPTPTGLRGYGLPNGDFDRAANQRLMLSALAAKAASLGTLSNPVKTGQLLDTLGTNVQTDLQTGDLQRLYALGKTINASNFRSVSLQDYLQDYATPDGQSALIPTAGLDDFSDIQTFISQQLSQTRPAQAPSASLRPF